MSKRMAHLIWWDQIGLEFPSPLESRLDSFLCIFKLPLCCTHVTRTRVRLVQPSLLPDVVLICLGQRDGVCVLRVSLVMHTRTHLAGFRRKTKIMAVRRNGEGYERYEAQDRGRCLCYDGL